MEPAAVRTALVRIGFLDAAAQAITDEQGIDSLEEIRLLSDDEISNLAKLIRRPGGVIPGQVNAAGNAVPNPGIQVNARAETNLKLAAFYLRHQVRIGRTVTPADVTLENIRSIRELRDYEDTWKASDDLPVINAKDWPKTMEAIHEYLRSYLGDKMIPLAYVVRKDEAVPTVEPEGGYATVQDEMIARAPHFRITAAGYATRPDISCQPAESLGDHCANHSRELVLDHSILEGLVEYGYSGIDARSKVRYLMDGIRTDKYDSVKTRIMSDAALRNDFDACVTLYQDFIKQTASKAKGSPSNVNISEVKVHSGNKRKRDEAEDRYYTKAEYAALTSAQKRDLAEKRKKRGHTPGAKDSKTGKDSKSKSGGEFKPKTMAKDLKALNRSVAQLAKQITKTDLINADDASVATESSNETQPRSIKSASGTNRTNASLTRQTTKSK
ncbi:hypothetical protein MHU86_16822 [Fragilaria crotonensis]|nr:hypothetical protein MHU86_16822 [Fragilaria crotonensis]